MHRWQEQILARIHQDPLQPKTVLCSSHAEGNLWLETFARHQDHIFNVSIQTFESLALEMAKLRMAEDDVQFISGQMVTWFIHSELLNLVRDGNLLLQRMTLSPGMVQVFSDAIADLRGAGVRASDLQSAQFYNQEKGQLVQQLLGRYETYLEQNRLADYAQVVQYATAELKMHQPHSRYHPLYFIPQSYQLDVVTQQFMISLTEIDQVEMIDDNVKNDLKTESATEVSFFHATGSLAETREVFRRILADDIPFDQVEIVVSGDQELLSVYNIAKNLDIPIHFLQGLPIVITNMGKLAHAFFNWISSNYDVSVIIHAMQEGVFRIPDEEISTHQFAKVLSEANIGWGRERYLSVLTRLIEEQEDDALEISGYRRLHQIFSGIFDTLPEPLESLPKIIEAMDKFLTEYGRILDEQDSQVFGQIRDFRESFRHVPDFGLTTDIVFQYLRERIAAFRVASVTRPEPSAIFVTTVGAGGLTGREATFVMGMSESQWSIGTWQNPILLDEERGKIPTGLFTSEHLLQDKMFRRQQFLHSLNGKLTFSYSAMDILDGRTESPAPELLLFYRKTTGNPDDDFSKLLTYLGEPISYAWQPASHAHGSVTQSLHAANSGLAIDTNDQWLGQLLTPTGLFRDGIEAILRAYPFLHDGINAGIERESTEFTVFDGLIDTKPGIVDAAYYSPTSLESLAKCPRQYFYRRILRLSPPDETQFDRTRWLDALQRGSLYHEIYRSYMQTVVDGQGHDEARLLQISHQVIDEFASIIPAPSVHVFEMEREEIRNAMRKFFTMEISRSTVTKFLEKEIGSWDEPFMLDLGQGLTLPIYGKVDRIDEISPHQYKIYDYKTGSDWGYHEKEYFRSGQQLQHALYAVAVEQWMRQEGYDPQASVTESAYVFPTPRARQEEVTFLQNRREDVQSLLQGLLSIPQQGLFVATGDSGNCNFCDFAAICGGAAAKQSSEKRELSADSGIKAILAEVESYE